MRRAFETYRPALVYHLAAVHFIPECDADPATTWRTNVEGTGVVAALAAAFGATLVFTSSAAVYRPSDAPHREHDAVEPIDVYGRSKLAAERAAARFRDVGARTVIARLFNVYGPGERTPHLIPPVVAQIAAGADEVVLGALDPRRDYVHVDDAVSALRLLADLPDGSIVNVATGRTTAVRDVVAMCAGIAGREVSIVEAPGLLRPVDRPCLHGDATTLGRATGWQPTIPLEVGLAEMLSASMSVEVAAG
jgi:UDP-glucose 4-epimerase